MTLTTLKGEYQESIKETEAIIERLKEGIKEYLREQPDNPKIKRLSEKPNCFILNSKDLEDTWTPFYHDYKLQYQAVEAIINSYPIETALKMIREICTPKMHNDVVYYKHPKAANRFHPEVVDKLKVLID